MTKRTRTNKIREEFEKAKTTGKQPNCPYCGAPLEIYHTQYESITWKWNAKKRTYEREITDIDPAIPVCASCETEDWDFINSGLLSF